VAPYLIHAQASEGVVVKEGQQVFQPDTNLAKGYNNMGNAFYDLGNLAKALACYQQALHLDTSFAEAHNNLGVALFRLNKVDEALASYEQSLRLKPGYAKAYYNLGLLYIRRAQWGNAVGVLKQALRHQPDHADAYCNLGYALSEQAKLEEAAQCYQEAVRIRPDLADAHWGLANIWLIRGDFEHAWPQYERWWRLEERSLRHWDHPYWDRSPLGGRTVLLKAQGGLGDTIQFVRYTAVLKQYGATAIVECQEPLLPLLASCPGIDRLIAAGSKPPAFDAYAPIPNLPAILNASLSTLPAKIPYLSADCKLQAKWQHKLSGRSGLKVGIAWQGNLKNRRDCLRSIPLPQFAPLARIQGVSLISLQKVPGAEQLDQVANQFPVIDLGTYLDEESGAFMDTAAVMKNVDLVITADTAIAHLAGALGVPVWVALPFVPDWRWLLNREDSPWYPTMRLFRQTKPGDWEGVFTRMAEVLSKNVAPLDRSRVRSRAKCQKRSQGDPSPLVDLNGSLLELGHNRALCAKEEAG
jgi:tetratricopeptide (TPR) repeat protein